MNYESFLQTKAPRVEAHGFVDVRAHDVHPLLFPFQRDIVAWAVRKGRCAIFASTGLGKTLMQLEWARQMHTRTGGRALLVAPLAVGPQTAEEAERLGMDVVVSREPCAATFTITNYENLEKFDPADFAAVVLDESSILKSTDGKTRTKILEDWTRIPLRLACTATPAPNDIGELGNHAQFAGAMSRTEMLARFFVHDSHTSARGGWRLKGHGQDVFWRWVASWAVFVRQPSDLGHSDDGHVLPPLSVVDERVETNFVPEGYLFAVELGGIHGRREARRATLEDRVARAVEIIRSTDEQFLVWVGLNDEGDALEKALGVNCVQISGTDDDDAKLDRERRWRAGEVQALITKPSMFGFGMNWQHCHRVMFLGLGDSWEQYHQAIRRCWRFGQKHPVTVQVVVSDAESEVATNIERKEEQAERMAAGVVAEMREAMAEELGHATSARHGYRIDERQGNAWRMLLGDCVERIREVETGSVGLSVYSPPFAAIYTYSASERDLGNVRDYEEFFRHYKYLIPELLRVHVPGRRTCVHVAQVSTTKVNDGVIGLRDFRADVVKAYVEAGWVYDGEVTVDKDPQAQAIRTKAKSLTFTQKNKDSSWTRPALADYVLLFRHPGESVQPVKTDVTNEEWIQWARPVWYGIRETNTLNAAEARNEKDERHVCPLQLDLIDRCVRLWSNEGDLVLSPFAGIGSEGVSSLRHGRRFVGIELKEDYWKVACRNLDAECRQTTLFDG